MWKLACCLTLFATVVTAYRHPATQKAGDRGSNKGGGGLCGAKCSSLFSNCLECAPGFKACKLCADLSAEGGFAYDVVDGECRKLITFDDLPDASYNEISSVGNYKGFTWSANFKYTTPSTDDPYVGYWRGDTDVTYTGFLPGVVSPRRVGYNNIGTGRISAEGFTFRVYSLYATAAAPGPGQQAKFTGYRNGNFIKVGQMLVNISSVPTKVVFNETFSGLDKFDVDLKEQGIVVIDNLVYG